MEPISDIPASFATERLHLRTALNDLDKQAKRLKRGGRAVGDILTECQSLARLWIYRLDTS